MRFIDSGDLLEISQSRSSSLLLDIDGSLADVVLDPDPIVVPRRLSLLLLSVKARLGGALAILSSRAMVAGTDGVLSPARDTPGHQAAELSIGKGHCVLLPVRSDLLANATLKLQRLSDIHPGCVIESRQEGIAVHWRLAPHLEPVVLDHVLELASELGSAFRLHRGERVAEIVAAETVKARAISLLMGHVPYKRRAPILIGSNLEDKSVLRLVRAMGGFSVQVGPGPAEAEYAVENSVSIRNWLMSWAGGERSRRAGQINVIQELQ